MRRNHLGRRQKRTGREHKRIDPGMRTMAQAPWRMQMTFGPMEQILKTIETTGDIDADKDGAVYRAPGHHAWHSMAGAIAGFAEFYEAHARISGKEMPTQALRRLANKFEYGVMIFQSDIDAVRADLAALKTETLPMTENYATAVLETMREAA